MARLVVTGSWARKYFVIENRVEIDNNRVEKNVKYDVCRLKDTVNANSPCGKSFVQTRKAGTTSLLRHLRQIHANDDEIGDELRLSNTGIEKVLLFIIY